jgi:hypothetical protein
LDLTQVGISGYKFINKFGSHDKDIFERGFINRFAAVIHMPFLCMKIPMHNGVLTVYGDQEAARN